MYIQQKPPVSEYLTAWGVAVFVVAWLWIGMKLCIAVSLLNNQ